MHLKDYLESNGIMKKWFAEKLGITSTYLLAFLHGNRPLATKYWTDIVLMTKGAVKLEDLLKMNNEYYEKRDKKKAEANSENTSQLSPR